MEIQRLLDEFRKITVQWKEKEVKGEGFNIIEFINRFWGIWETKHSQILGFLLNPRETHGQGGLFLKLFLQELRIIGEKDDINPNDWIIEVEKRSNSRDQIDILIQSHCLEVSIVIENKSNGAEDQPYQLYRYWESAIYNFHNGNKEKSLDPKYSRVVYLPKNGAPSLQTRTRMKDYKEPYPEVLELEDKELELDKQRGKIISCWTYYEDIRDWLEKCVNEIKGENHIIKHFIKNYIEFWDIIKLKDDFYMNELEKIFNTQEDWNYINEIIYNLSKFKDLWKTKVINNFSKKMKDIDADKSFFYNYEPNDCRWTYGGRWGDIAFIFMPSDGLYIWKENFKEYKNDYIDSFNDIFGDDFKWYEDRSNFIMEAKNEKMNLADDKTLINNEYLFYKIKEIIEKYTKKEEVKSLFREINDRFKK